MNGFLKIAFSVCLILQLLVGPVLAAEEVYFYHTDPVGTPMAMSNAAGQKVWEADYKPFGEEYTLDNSPENDKRFVGKVKDEETGLNYFGARYLSAGMGRFLAPDPVRAVDPRTGKIGFSLLANPQRTNLYAYSMNNPYKYVDEDGEFAVVLAAFLVTKVTAAVLAWGSMRGSLAAADGLSKITGNGGAENLNQAKAAIDQGSGLAMTVTLAEASGIAAVGAGVEAGAVATSPGAYVAATRIANDPRVVDFVDGFLSPTPPSMGTPVVISSKLATKLPAAAKTVAEKLVLPAGGMGKVGRDAIDKIMDN